MANDRRAKVAKAAYNPYPKFVQSPKALAGNSLGRSGLQYFLPGFIRRDFLPELQGRNLWLTYTEMGDNCSYCGAVLNAFAMFIRRAHWKVDPVDDANKDNGSAEFLEECQNDMSHSWQTIIAAAARTVPQYGFCPLEIIYKERQGEHDDHRYSSKFDDGEIGWSNLAYRAPDSVFHWDYDPEDVTKILGFTQLAAPDYRLQFIPIEKIVLLRSDPGKDSPEGRSVLRSAWRAWRTKKYMEDMRNTIIERGGAGIPWAEVPANIANAPAMTAIDPNDAAAQDALASYNSLVGTLENIVVSEQKWIITPQVWNEQGQPLIKVSFLQPSQNADIVGHITASIEAEAKAILISTMTEFLSLGMGNSGSLALSRDKTDNFTLAVEANLQSFQESINNQAVRRLFALNPQFEFEKKRPIPRIVYDPIVPIATQDVVAILSLFEKAGWDLSQQRGIRDTIIDNLGLPNYVEDETKDLLQEHGDSPIESLLDGQSAIDTILNPR
jgi:hypothetical protein